MSDHARIGDPMQRRNIRVTSTVLAMMALIAGAVNIAAQQPLETETARLPFARAMLIGTTLEYQSSPQGSEIAFPFAFEYGLTRRLAVLVEPVFYTGINPAGKRGARGPGDLEATVQFLAREERGWAPAIALSAEVKIPTARNRLIGTGKADFTPYVIASKRFGASGRFDAHANVGYSFLGQPAGVTVQNTLNLALALETHLTPRWDLLGEVLSTTAATAGEGGGENSTTSPEIAGAEQVGMLGARYLMRPGLWLSFGVTYDNTRAVLFRPGLTFELPF